jgi:PRTRC genetic system ThiF family protein
MSTLTLQIEKQYQVLLGTADTIHILLVGVGGTGSWLALSLGRLAYHARSKGVKIQLTLVDHDTVEMGNIGRQAHAPGDYGYPKCVSLAQRLNLALGLDLTAIPRPFTVELGQRWQRHWQGTPTLSTSLVIGAVDNAAARQEIARFIHSCRGQCWWLDGGNAAASGQVLLGNLTEPAQFQVDEAMGLLNGLPAPHLQEPGLLAPEPEAQPLSCTALTLREEQSLMVNAQVAAIAAQYVYDFTLTRRLAYLASYFTLAPAPATVSHRLTAGVVSRFWREPAG